MPKQSKSSDKADIPFEDKMAALTTKLNEQFLRSNELQQSIRLNLKNLGYD